ncbi:MAG: hypothetical protein NZV14_08645 [Bryobacteraceae bacterium]|nr:hypothetical protein [Bryobacteraceae bacterium]MDW8378216.1 hypothetical protein [Bryobacterales bacterium]
MQPLICWRGRRLHVGQLPDGLRMLLGLFADFMMRFESAETDSGVLIVDGLDSHCHPQWQARILPALRLVFPTIQIIATAYSPHLLNSCPEVKFTCSKRV